MNDINILLIVPKYEAVTKKNYDYIFPIGLGYIASAIKEAGFKIDCINLNHHEGKIEDILNNFLSEKKYNIVLTGNMISGYTISEKIINVVREHKTHPKIIFGGLMITCDPELVFEDLKIDFGVIGEGEETIIELLECIKNNENPTKIKGIIFKDENKKIIFTGRRKPSRNLDSLPFPDYESLGYEEYLNNTLPTYSYINSVFENPRCYYICGSRSCPYQCTFCYHYDFYRERTVDNIIKELAFVIRKYRINRILMCDECIAVRKDKLLEFCKRIKELIGDFDWEIKWTAPIRVDVIDKNILRTLKESGCDVIGYGLESYSPDVLKSMKKNITPEQIDFAIKEAMNQKMAIQSHFIFGDPSETVETYKTTLDYWKKECIGQFNLTMIVPYPGTENYKHCLKKGLIKDKLKFFRNVDVIINMTENMNDAEFKQMYNEMLDALAKYRKVVQPSRFKGERDNFYRLEVKCPFCDEKLEYKNMLIKNKLTYRFLVMCKNCHKRFYIASFLMKIAYKNFEKTKKIKRFLSNLNKKLEKRNL